MNKPFYVYVYLDPRKPGYYLYDNLSLNFEPFYIGKGTKGRRYSHLREAKREEEIPRWSNPLKMNKIKKLLEEGYEPLIEILEDNLTNEEAAEREAFWIRRIGKFIDGLGPLTNKADGDPFQGKMVLRGKNHPGYGKPRSIETREKISRNHRDCSGARNSRSKSWKLVSPTGEIHLCKGTLKSTCNSLGINQALLRYIRNKGPYTAEMYKKTYESGRVKKEVRFQSEKVKQLALNTIGWSLEEIDE